MLKKVGNVQKKFINVNNISISLILILTMIISLSFCCITNNYNASASSFFTPSPPTGNTLSDINIENEYTIITSEAGSSWMFDWADGSYSDWIVVGDSDTSISQTHTWYSYGNFEVRVKQRNVYLTESTWSDPLIVTIAPPSDLDGDGWSNDLEIAYGKDPENFQDYPLDTDGDDVPDDDSTDGAYIGDTDDDNDGLSDVLEISLGSNTKKFGDVEFLVIDSTTYCLVDTNENEKFDLLYNTLTELRTRAKFENGITLLDINGDGSYDYNYDQGFLVVYKEPFKIPWLYVILGVIVAVLIILFILFKKGVLYLYEEEYIVEE
jgi:hypothetical protein